MGYLIASGSTSVHDYLAGLCRMESIALTFTTYLKVF
jgi:hypothetical protein